MNREMCNRFGIFSHELDVFFPLSKLLSTTILKPYDEGHLEIFHKNQSISMHQLLSSINTIDFKFVGSKSEISAKTNYGLPGNHVKKSIHYKITKDNQSHIELITESNQLFYYVFTPNLLYSYNSGIACNVLIKKDTLLEKIKKSLRKLEPEVVDGILFFEGIQSFTTNKKIINLCLRNHQGEYYDFNSLMYVAIHELAHVMCLDIGHTKNFYKKMNQLLEKAIQLQIYDDSIPMISNYCPIISTS